MKKSQSRRQFLDLSIKAGIIVPALGASILSCKEKPTTDATDSPAPLNVLILGGTSFLGPHQIATLLGRGHKVSIFTRGKTKPKIHTDLFDQVEHLIGDRENDLTALENRSWDVVIDNSGRKVEWTKKTANLLKDTCGLYLYTSSTGVFYPYDDDQYTEEDPIVLSMPEGLTEDEAYEQEYGVMKGNSELETIKAFGADRSIIVRPTYMLGPGDKTNRFMHWFLSIERGGEVLLTGKENDAVQYIDIRDVADWMVYLIEEKKAGTYNAVGPAESSNILSYANQIKKALNSDASFVQVDDYEFLKDHELYYVIPWILPEGKHEGSVQISNAKAKANGIKYRPFENSLMDTFEWWKSDLVDADRRDKYEADPEALHNRQAEILKKWKAMEG